ncbi:O-antigen ligase family protein [Flavobacterium sp. CYK-55]|uniref:O-antigen ligase family protein n=1 Tax=Flavobacterium sp. CYK-55 TaxID=2835529 RepID=UPI001BCCEF42|nr:O-antigen ligase family protein [Flavobacterium sp. CYK-55]MBS7787755.1 O-antigen ligase family protein [Flavobacterium sp. CYK-55]
MSTIVNGFNPENHATIAKWMASSVFLVVVSIELYQERLSFKTLVNGITVFFGLAVLGAYFDVYQMMQNSSSILKHMSEIKSFFGNKNLLSSALFLCVPFVLISSQHSPKQQLISRLLLLLSIPILLLTQTRAVWLAFFVFILVIGFYKLKSNLATKAILFVGILALGFSISEFILPKFRAIKDDKFSNIYLSKLGNQNTLNSRNIYWESAYKMWQEQPIFGIGPGNFGQLFSAYNTNKMSVEMANGTETLQRVHNDFLSILAESGLLGFLSFMSIWILTIYWAVQLIQQATEKTEKSTYLFLLAGLLGFAVIVFLDFPFERIEHQLIFVTIIAFIFVWSFKKKKKQTKSLKKSDVVIVLTCFIIYATTVAAMRLMSEIHMMKVYQAKAQGNWSEVIYEAKKARNSFYQLDPTGIPVEWYQGIAYFGQGELEQSQASFESAFKASPYQVQVLHNLGAVYEQKKEIDSAMIYYQKALEISPAFEEALLSLSACYYKKGRYQQAFNTIEKVEPKSKNKRYRPYLAKILVKKLNSILAKMNQPTLSGFMAKEMNSVEKINNFYWVARAHKVNLEKQIILQKKSADYYWYERSVKLAHK